MEPYLASTDIHGDQIKELIKELKQGKELAKQLQIHLNVPSSRHETREFLVHKILISYDKVLSMLHSNTTTGGDQPHITGTTTGILSESPRSFSGSPRSQDSDRDFNDPDNKDSSRKRKAMPRWTKQVQVCPGSGLEGPLDDGYSWRKYGQKEILGAKFPRGYYRCTRRHVQGCLATKQVQRSDNDPTIFEITYRGRHTCSQASNSIPPPEPTSLTTTVHNQPQHDHQNQHQHSQEVLLSFKTGLKVITEDLDNNKTHELQQSIDPNTSFYFPSTSNKEPENYSFSQYFDMLGNNFGGNNISSPSFVSPATSASSYNLSVSPPNMSTTFGGNNFQNLPASDSELTEIISAATSAATSPTIGVSYQFGHLEFNSNFTFDNPGFFS